MMSLTYTSLSILHLLSHSQRRAISRSRVESTVSASSRGRGAGLPAAQPGDRVLCSHRGLASGALWERGRCMGALENY